MALGKGHLEMATLLIEKGAGVDKANKVSDWGGDHCELHLS